MDFYPGTLRSIFQTGVGASTKSITGSTEISSNEWQHLAVTWDGVTMKGYYNGVFEATNSFDGSIKISDGDVEIGRYSGGCLCLIIMAS